MNLILFVFQVKTLAKLVHLHTPQTGAYEITNPCANSDETSQLILARCDVETDGGGWTVILRRRRNEPSTSFHRGWDDYENGFGDPNHEYWIGLRNIHCLTMRDNVDLMIDLRQDDGNGMTWIYSHFKVAGSDDHYRLDIAGGIGPSDGYDVMAHLNGSQFTTRDSDHDRVTGNCAQRTTYGSAWWHTNCYYVQLTGPPSTGVYWYKGTGTVTSTSSYTYYNNVEMKIRPKSCNGECP